MSKPDPARLLLDSFNSCKHEDRSLAIFEAEQLAARVEKVIALHAEDEYERGVCTHCSMPLPCPTRRALDGEDV